TSSIDRQGLFATEPIRRGTRVVEYTGEKISKRESTRRLAAYNNYIFYLNALYDIDGETLENTARYMNHSCEPNCEVEMTTTQIWLVALRDIKAGEELTFNYGYDASEYERFPCNCGTRSCCGYIVGREYWGLIKST
ncbi:MAG: SET domain-containing protein, partial [Candidatus Tectomicrobia bacterium]|nr:SET domain-containing protein [Candidatus Tectomicrobia bacterium]